LKFQGKKELKENFGEPDNSQSSLVNNLYHKGQSKKFFLSNIERKNILIIKSKRKTQIFQQGKIYQRN